MIYILSQNDFACDAHMMMMSDLPQAKTCVHSSAKSSNTIITNTMKHKGFSI